VCYGLSKRVIQVSCDSLKSTMFFKRRGKLASRNTVLKRCSFVVVSCDSSAYLHLLPVRENRKTQLMRQSTLLSCKQATVEGSVCFMVMLNYCVHLISKCSSRACFCIQEIELDHSTTHGKFCSWVMTSHCFLHKLLVHGYSMKHFV